MDSCHFVSSHTLSTLFSSMWFLVCVLGHVVYGDVYLYLCMYIYVCVNVKRSID